VLRRAILQKVALMNTAMSSQMEEAKRIVMMNKLQMTQMINVHT